MCDYSLLAQGYRQELAKVRDKIKLYVFPSRTKGFTYASETKTFRAMVREKGFWSAVLESVAMDLQSPVPPCVCIPHGACLRLFAVPKKIRRRFGVGRDVIVKFVQLSGDAYSHRDAVQFPNGDELSLQDFPGGLRACVLSLQDLDPQAELAEETDFTGVVTPHGAEV